MIGTRCKDTGCKERSASLDYVRPCQDRKETTIYHSVEPGEAILFSRYGNGPAQWMLTAPLPALEKPVEHSIQYFWSVHVFPSGSCETPGTLLMKPSYLVSLWTRASLSRCPNRKPNWEVHFRSIYWCWGLKLGPWSWGLGLVGKVLARQICRPEFYP